jgi:hypothetical protein
MRLEERIVLDAAGAATASQTDPTKDQSASSSSSLADAAKVAADSSSSSSSAANAAATPTADAQTASTANKDSGPVRVLVVDSNADPSEALAAAALSNVLTVTYDGDHATPDQILAAIKTALNGRQAESIAFAAHELGAGRFHLAGSATVSDDSLSNDASMQAFWREVGSLVTDTGRVDLLNCGLSATLEGAVVVADLEALTGRSVASSCDATGSADAGGDWILEVGDVNLVGTYFDADRLASFHGTLEAESIVSGSTGSVGDSFGKSVSISGNYAVIGAYLDDTKATDAGAAYIFFWNGSAWTQQAKLTALDGAASDWFGWSVSISGDTVAVGAVNYDEGSRIDTGAVYLYQRSGTTWTQMNKLTTIGNDATRASSDYYGSSVALTSTALLIGASYADVGTKADAGAVYTYSRSGSSLTYLGKVTATDAAADDHFGISLALDGSYAVVGASGSDARGVDSGAAYVFFLSGTWGQQAKITASDGAAGDAFGNSVSISGSTLVVGACKADSGVLTDAGAAYVFTRSGTSWTQSTKITAATQAAYDQFGSSVGISGTRIVVGADMYNYGGRQDSGAVYEYEYALDSLSATYKWTQQHLLKGSDYAALGHFGTAVAIEGVNVAIGAIRDSTLKGQGYLYNLTSSGLPNSGGDLPGSGGTPVNTGGSLGAGSPSLVNGIEAQTATENVAWSYTVPTSTFTDDGGTANLTWSASSFATSNLPSWLHFNAATHTFSGTPGDYDNGTYLVRVTVTDATGKTATTTFDITVNGVNDAPEISGAVANRAVDDVATVNPFDSLVIADKDGGQAETVTVALDDATKGVFTAASLAASGFSQTGAGVYRFTGTAEQAQAAIRQLVFNPADNLGAYGSTTTTRFTVTVADDAGASVVNSSTTVVSKVSNRAATATNTTQTISYVEDAASLGMTPIVVSDQDTGDEITVTLTLSDTAAGSLTTGSGNGETFGNGVWTVKGTVDQVNAALAAVRFTPAANYDKDASIRVHVADRAGYGPADGTITLDATPVQDTPTTGPSAVAAVEDTTYVFSLSDFTFTDPDTGDALQKVQITSVPAHGRLVLNTGGGDVDVTSLQEISRADIAAGHLKFIPAADENGSGYASFGYKVSDGTAYSVLSATLTVNVTAVEDAPTAANASVTTSPNTDYAFTLADFHFSDVDTGDALQSVSFDQLPTAGTLLLNGVAVSAGQAVSRADIAAGRLIFRPETDMGGSGYATMAFRVSDGQLSSAQSYALSVDVDTPGVNDAPAVIKPSQTLAVNEDGTLALSGASRISIVDVDSGGAEEVVTLTSTHGLMSLGSTSGLTLLGGSTAGSNTMTLRGTVADINAALATLSFSSDQYFNGQATIQVTVDDQGNSGAGGAKTGTRTLAVTVNPVADQPQDVTLATLEDTRTSAFNLLRSAHDGSEVGYFKITDITGGTLYDSSGTVVANGAFITFAQSQGMTFVPSADRTAQASFHYQASTDGTTVGAKSLTPATVAVNITPVGDTPRNVTVAAVEDTLSQTFSLARNASDGTEVTHFRITGITGGTLYDHEGNVVHNGDYITYAASQGMRFMPDADRNAQASFDYQASEDGTTVAAQSLTAARVSVNITPVGDTPQDVHVATVEDTMSAAFNLVRNANDGSEVAYFKITGITGGTLYDASGKVVTDGSYITYAASQGMRFLPSANNDGSASFSYQASEDGVSVSSQSWTPATVTVDITPVGDTPRVTSLIVPENALSDLIILDRNSSDGAEVTHFRISGITGGALYLADGTTQVHDGDYITYAQGQAGLRFAPEAYSTATARFYVQSSQDGATVAAQSGRALSTVSVMPIASTDTPFSYQVPREVFIQVIWGQEQVSLVATLPDGSPLPSWLHFDPATRTFSGTPSDGDVGTTIVRVRSTHPLGSPTEPVPNFMDVALTVQRAPQVAVPLEGRSTLEKGEFSATIPAGTFTDGEGDALTYSATLADGSALPAWLHFDAATGTFSGHPQNDDVGILTVRVTATDPVGAKVSSNFALEVINVNDAPTASTASQEAKSIVAGNTLNLNVPESTFQDIDKGDSLTWTASLEGGGSLPEWLKFDASSRTFSGLPPDTAVGLLKIMLTATDREGAKATSTLSLNVLDAPKVTSNTPGQMISLGDSARNTSAEAASPSLSASVPAAASALGSLTAPSLSMSLAGPVHSGDLFQAASRTFGGSLAGTGGLFGETGGGFSSLAGANGRTGERGGANRDASPETSGDGLLARAMNALEGRFSAYFQRLSASGVEGYAPEQLRAIDRSLAAAEAYGERLGAQLAGEQARMTPEEAARYAVRLQEYRETVETLRAQVEGTLRLAQGPGREAA